MRKFWLRKKTMPGIASDVDAYIESNLEAWAASFDQLLEQVILRRGPVCLVAAGLLASGLTSFSKTGLWPHLFIHVVSGISILSFWKLKKLLPKRVGSEDLLSLIVLILVVEWSLSFVLYNRASLLKLSTTTPTLLTVMIYILTFGRTRLRAAIKAIVTTSIFFVSIALLNVQFFKTNADGFGIGVLIGVFIQMALDFIIRFRFFIVGQSRKISERARETIAILESVRHAIFIIGPEEVLLSAPVRSLYDIFGLAPGTAIEQPLSTLYADALEPERDLLDRSKNSLLGAIGDDSLSFEMNSAQFVQKLIKPHPSGNRSIDLLYQPVVNNQGVITGILISATDVTSEEKDRQLANAKAIELQNVGVLAQTGEARFTRIENAIAETLAVISKGEAVSLVRLHTAKGEARTLGFNALAAKIHEIESSINSAKPVKPQIESIWDDVQELRTIGCQILGWGSRSLEEMQTYRLVDSIVSAAMSGMALPEDVLQRTRLFLPRPSAIVTEMQRVIQIVAGRVGKLTPALKIELSGSHEEPCLFKAGAESLRESLLHIFSNAVDHGIELPSERRMCGKSESGTITVTISRDDAFVKIVVVDDGRGFDLERIQTKAVKQGFLVSAMDQAPSEIVTIVMAEGFSTKDQASEISGRGVGLKAAVEATVKAGGTITIEEYVDPTWKPSLGFFRGAFVIRLPLAL